MVKDLTPITIQLPKVLRERARVVAKRLHTTTTQLIREGLDQRCLQFEERFRREDEAKEAAKEAKKERGLLGFGGRFGGRFGGGIRSQLASLLDATEPDADAPRSDERLERIYGELALKIIEAGDDKDEIRYRATDAVRVIKLEYPLSHPPDPEILGTLEKHIIRIRDEQKEKAKEVVAHSYDTFVTSLRGQRANESK